MLARTTLSHNLGTVTSQVARTTVGTARLRLNRFSTTTAKMVQVGDSIPDVECTENSPGEKVNLSKELAQGRGLIIGVPAAFSPGCSETMLPGYMVDERTKKAGKAFVVAVNDAFVMKAWGKALDEDKSSGLRFIGDQACAHSKAWDVTFDASPLLGNVRGKRYAVETQDGKVTKVFVEPDNIGISGSAADKFFDSK